MRFTPSSIPRQVTPLNTPRRIANSEKALARQRESFGMFPEMAPQETAEERLNRFDVELGERFARLRSGEARCWCKARRFLRTVTPEQRAEFLAYYHRMMENFPCLGTGAYFSDLVRGHFGAQAVEAVQ